MSTPGNSSANVTLLILWGVATVFLMVLCLLLFLACMGLAEENTRLERRLSVVTGVPY